MQTYIAFLRGINVGGNSLIKMADLKASLSKGELENVRTYIQSGNIIFDSNITDEQKLAKLITGAIENTFGISVSVAVFSKQEWQHVISAAPAWWGKDQTWKHNIIIMIKPFDMAKT